MTVHTNDLQPDIDEIQSLLRSHDRRDRHIGYTTLQEKAIYLYGKVSADNVLALVAAILNESDPKLREMGLLGLKKFQDAGVNLPEKIKSRDAIDPPPPPESCEEESLGQHIWASFTQDSAVFAVCDSELLRRDEAAEIQLGRRLSFDDFPRTDFLHFLTSEQRAHLVLQGHPYKAICVVGRPGLLGEAFLSQIHYRKSSGDPRNPTVERTRFDFETHQRPRDLPRNSLDPNYHFISETFGDGTCERHFTQEDGKLRVDYGLLQRYAVELAGGTLIVVVCAGASSLGTLGAALWASLMLFPSQRKLGDGTAIPAPPKIRSDSRIEALVRVTADSTLGVWEAPRVEPIKLLADGRKWSTSDKKWLVAPPDEVTVVDRAGRPVEVHFDRKVHRLRQGKNMFNLIVSLVEMTLHGSQWIEVSELRNMTLIWEEKISKNEEVTGEYVHSQLITLRQRHLGEALRIEGDRVSLRCKIRRVDKT